jgi:hypothetical protein
VPELTIEILCEQAARFAAVESSHREPALYGKDSGKTVGNYLEQKFRAYLRNLDYSFVDGNAANGVDFPGLEVDIKVTSFIRPQSSSPFRSVRQKIYGLGHSLLIFVYDKADDPANRTATLRITDTIFVQSERTGDFQLTSGLLKILQNDGNSDDIVSFLSERALPVDESELERLAEEIVARPPLLGYLTISTAFQWRLHYQRVIARAGTVEGVHVLYRGAGL